MPPENSEKKENGNSVLEPLNSAQKTLKTLSMGITREQLYSRPPEKLRETFIKELKQESGVMSGNFSAAGNKNFERWIGLKHLIPPQYTYIEVTTPSGQILKSEERRGNGSFYRADGKYLAIWEGYSFKAYAEKPEKEPDETEPAPIKTAEASKLPEVSSNQTVFVGDSITVGLSRNLSESEIIAKGGKQTSWMLKNFLEFIEEKNAGLHPDVKRVVIYGGINDIASLKTPEQIEKNLTAIYQTAHEVGLTVVACTMHQWDTQAFIDRFNKRKKTAYPLSAKELDDRKEKLNNWILAQKGGLVDEVINFQTEMGSTDDSTFKRGRDKLHLSPEGYKQTAELIKSRANIMA